MPPDKFINEYLVNHDEDARLFKGAFEIDSYLLELT